MLKTIDRIQIAAPDAADAAAGWVAFLGAEFDRKVRVHALGALRSTYRLGRGAIEFLEPDGAGPVQDALHRRGRAHLFAGGASTAELEGTVAALRKRGVDAVIEGGQAFLNAKPALGVEFPFVLSPYQDREPVGLIDFLYEVTLLARDPKDVVSRFAGLFGLDGSNFVSISSDKFDYAGVLTLFTRGDLHRFEVICPISDASTMGRYLARTGESFYMCFAESPNLLEIERRVLARGVGITVDRPAGRAGDEVADQMWIHPPGLGGVMLGLSRPTMAWTWSGHPERVRAIV